MRRLLIAFALLLTAAPAGASPRALTPVNEETGFALAGDAALVSTVGESSLQVSAFPLDGGAARPVFSLEAPNGLHPDGRRIGASAARAAMTVTFGEGSSDIAAVQAFGGPPGGPWAPFAPLVTAQDDESFVFPFGQQVDGDRLFTTEIRGELDKLAVVARDPEAHDVAFASPEDVLFATFAGDLVAHPHGSSLVVREWRTGAVRSTTKVPDDIEAIALRPDGRVAVTTSEDELYELRPGGKLRRLSRDARRPLAYAGEHILFSTSEDQPRVVSPAGRIRRFGPPTETFGGFVTEGERVLWVANDCLLVDTVTAPPSTAPGAGPCPRSELSLEDRANPHLGHTLPVVLRCVSAPRACRGTVRLTAAKNPGVNVHTISHAERFVIPIGKSKRIRVRLTARGYRILRRYVAAEGDALVGVDARTADHADLPDHRAQAILVLPRGAR